MSDFKNNDDRIQGSNGQSLFGGKQQEQKTQFTGQSNFFGQGNKKQGANFLNQAKGLFKFDEDENSEMCNESDINESKPMPGFGVSPGKQESSSQNIFSNIPSNNNHSLFTQNNTNQFQGSQNNLFGQNFQTQNSQFGQTSQSFIQQASSGQQQTNFIQNMSPTKQEFPKVNTKGIFSKSVNQNQSILDPNKFEIHDKAGQNLDILQNLANALDIQFVKYEFSSECVLNQKNLVIFEEYANVYQQLQIKMRHQGTILKKTEHKKMITQAIISQTLQSYRTILENTLKRCYEENSNLSFNLAKSIYLLDIFQLVFLPGPVSIRLTTIFKVHQLKSTFNSKEIKEEQDGLKMIIKYLADLDFIKAYQVFLQCFEKYKNEKAFLVIQKYLKTFKQIFDVSAFQQENSQFQNEESVDDKQAIQLVNQLQQFQKDYDDMHQEFLKLSHQEITVKEFGFLISLFAGNKDSFMQAEQFFADQTSQQKFFSLLILNSMFSQNHIWKENQNQQEVYKSISKLMNENQPKQSEDSFFEYFTSALKENNPKQFLDIVQQQTQIQDDLASETPIIITHLHNLFNHYQLQPLDLDPEFFEKFEEVNFNEVVLPITSYLFNQICIKTSEEQQNDEILDAYWEIISKYTQLIVKNKLKRRATFFFGNLIIQKITENSMKKNIILYLVSKFIEQIRKNYGIKEIQLQIRGLPLPQRINSQGLDIAKWFLVTVAEFLRSKKNYAANFEVIYYHLRKVCYETYEQYMLEFSQFYLEEAFRETGQYPTYLFIETQTGKDIENIVKQLEQCSTATRKILEEIQRDREGVENLTQASEIYLVNFKSLFVLLKLSQVAHQNNDFYGLTNLLNEVLEIYGGSPELMSQFILKEVQTIFSKPEVNLSTVLGNDEGIKVVSQLRHLTSKIQSWALQGLNEEQLGLSVSFEEVVEWNHNLKQYLSLY